MVAERKAHVGKYKNRFARHLIYMRSKDLSFSDNETMSFIKKNLESAANILNELVLSNRTHTRAPGLNIAWYFECTRERNQLFQEILSLICCIVAPSE